MLLLNNDVTLLLKGAPTVYDCPNCGRTFGNRHNRHEHQIACKVVKRPRMDWGDLLLFSSKFVVSVRDSLSGKLGKNTSSSMSVLGLSDGVGLSGGDIRWNEWGVSSQQASMLTSGPSISSSSIVYPVDGDTTSALNSGASSGAISTSERKNIYTYITKMLITVL